MANGKVTDCFCEPLNSPNKFLFCICTASANATIIPFLTAFLSVSCAVTTIPPAITTWSAGARKESR